MQAFVVQVKYIANYDHRKKPVVMLEVPKNLLNRTSEEGNKNQ